MNEHTFGVETKKKPSPMNLQPITDPKDMRAMGIPSHKDFRHMGVPDQKNISAMLGTTRPKGPHSGAIPPHPPAKKMPCSLPLEDPPNPAEVEALRGELHKTQNQVQALKEECEQGVGIASVSFTKK